MFEFAIDDGMTDFGIKTNIAILIFEGEFGKFEFKNPLNSKHC